MDNLIFLYIPKCGGTTFHEIIRRQFNNLNIYSIDFKNGKLATDEFLKLSQIDRDKINLLRGHMKFGLHELMNQPFKYVTFLRDPVKRVISHYTYAKKHPNQALHSFAMKRSLSQFVKDIDPYINNSILDKLSNLPIDSPIEMKFDVAIENLERFFPVVGILESVLGILESFDELLVRMKHEFNWGNPY
jgi:hypothetical protein